MFLSIEKRLSFVVYQTRQYKRIKNITEKNKHKWTLNEEVYSVIKILTYCRISSGKSTLLFLLYNAKL